MNVLATCIARVLKLIKRSFLAPFQWSSVLMWIYDLQYKATLAKILRQNEKLKKKSVGIIFQCRRYRAVSSMLMTIDQAVSDMALNLQYLPYEYVLAEVNLFQKCIRTSHGCDPGCHNPKLPFCQKRLTKVMDWWRQLSTMSVNALGKAFHKW